MLAWMPYQSYLAAGGFTTGTWGNASTGGGGRSIIPASSQIAGFRFQAPANGTLSAVKLNVQSVTVAEDFVQKLYTDAAGPSPGTQVGSNSSTLTISTTGDKTFTSAGDQIVTSGTFYWIIFDRPGAGTPSINVDTCADDASYQSGRAATITTITDNLPSLEDFRVEIVAT